MPDLIHGGTLKVTHARGSRVHEKQAYAVVFSQTILARVVLLPVACGYPIAHLNYLTWDSETDVSATKRVGLGRYR